MLCYRKEIMIMTLFVQYKNTKSVLILQHQ